MSSSEEALWYDQGRGSARDLAPRGGSSLVDVLDRVLDKGIVVAGDIAINLLDIELLTIKLRLVIASLETAREVGINWWENDPWLSAGASNGPSGRELEDENRRLRERIRALESGEEGRG